MKDFRISVASDVDVLKPREGHLSHFTSRFGGWGRVRITHVDDLRIEVGVTFTVEGSSVLDVIDRYRDDFELLQGIMRGIEVAETKRFKFCFPMIAGERLDGTFIRVNPDSGEPMYSDD